MSETSGLTLVLWKEEWLSGGFSRLLRVRRPLTMLRGKDWSANMSVISP